MPKAIIIGASSGIGRALARRLAREGYELGLAARRLPLLVELQQEIGPAARVKQMDVSDPEQAMRLLAELIDQMGGVDLVIVNAGVGRVNPELDWQAEKQTIDVNVRGFTAMVNVAMRHFLQQGRGHLVGISSVAALRGNRLAPAYGASKAFISHYLEGMRCKTIQLGLPITVTDIQPGWVDTALAQGATLFWVASPEVAADQIFAAIRRKKRHAYVTRRWRLIAWLLKVAPDWAFCRYG